jgi:hypothetical protein
VSDQQYQPQAQIFNSKGLSALAVIDRSPQDSYWNLEGFEVRQEGALSSILGRVAITSDGTNNFPLNSPAPLPATVNNLTRLKSVGQTYRYATYAQNTGFVFRRNGDTGGAYTPIPIGGALSGGRFTAVTYRPSFSSTPFIFFADTTYMFKDNGTYSGMQNWGVYPPFGYVEAAVAPTNSYSITSIADNPSINVAAVNGYTQSGNIVTVTAATPGSFAGVQVGDVLIISGSGTGDYDGVWQVSMGPDPTNTTIQFVHTSSGLPNDGGGTVNINLSTVTLSATASPAIVAGAVATISGNTNPSYNAALTVRTGSGGGATFVISTPGGLYGAGTGGTAVVSQSGPDVTGGVSYDYRITIYDQSTGGESNPTAVFVPSRNVSPVNQAVLVTWPISVFDDGGFSGSQFYLRIYRRGGTLTGTVIQGNAGFTGWLLVGTVPASATSFLDTQTDANIANNPVLAIDNDPPVTTQLASQYNTTTVGVTAAGFQAMSVADASTFLEYQVAVIDTGDNQEVVFIGGELSSTKFEAYFQIPHAAGVPVVISTKPLQFMNLAAIAFEQAFVAGDPVNPNRLYYSKPQNPEAFPPQNYIEIGVPTDPIMAVIGIRGQVFVLTLNRIYRVLSVGTGTPDPVPTGSRHGLSANFAWAIVEESIIYLSYDGVYEFLADDSNCISKPIEWLLSDKQPNLGPLDPINPALRSQAFAAYNKNEWFLCYTGMSGLKRRLIYDTLMKRWRNDSLPCDAMYFEEDTGELVISKNEDGMVYKDRRSNWDQNGYVAGALQSTPIPLVIQTPALDQGSPRNDKIYNEFTLDLDTGGNTLSVFLLFNNGQTSISLGAVTTASNGRLQITFPINDGDGEVSKNVALLITGSVSPTTGPVHLYQWHIKAAVDAEQRKSFDSYWIKMGTDEFKFVKQGYFEYVSLGGPISFSVYLEGSQTPAYQFNLLQAGVRTSVKVRFPPFKAKLWRFVALSASDFQLYGESFVELKPITTDKGYGKMKFGQITAQGGV